MTAPLHIRDHGSARLNLCGEEGGQATYPTAATCGMCRAVYADDVDRDPLHIDPDTSGWTPGPDMPETPRTPHLRDCCGRPSDEHPRTDSTMRGQCHGPHAGVEISMHYDGRGYVCGLCALDEFHGAHTHDLNLTEVRMSDCRYGCKVWRCESCSEEQVQHSATYGCSGGAA